MVQMVYSERFFKTFRNLPDQHLRETRKALEKLMFLRYDSGLRVKRLKLRPGRAVWEARVNRECRLVFTFGNHFLKTLSNASDLFIHIGDLITDHDKVGLLVSRTDPYGFSWLSSDPIGEEPEWRGFFPENPCIDLTELIAQSFSGLIEMFFKVRPARNESELRESSLRPSLGPMAPSAAAMTLVFPERPCSVARANS